MELTGYVLSVKFTPQPALSQRTHIGSLTCKIQGMQGKGRETEQDTCFTWAAGSQEEGRRNSLKVTKQMSHPSFPREGWVRRQKGARCVTQRELPHHKRLQDWNKQALSGPTAHKAEKESNRHAPKEPLRLSGKIHGGSNTRHHKGIYGVNPYRQPKKTVIIQSKCFVFGDGWSTQSQRWARKQERV